MRNVVVLIPVFIISENELEFGVVYHFPLCLKQLSELKENMRAT